MTEPPSPSPGIAYNLYLPSLDRGGAHLAIALFRQGHNVSQEIGDRILRSGAANSGFMQRNPEWAARVAVSAGQHYEALPGLHYRLFREADDDPRACLEFWANPKANVALPWEERLFKVPFLLFDHGGLTVDMAIAIGQQIAERYPLPDDEW